MDSSSAYMYHQPYIHHGYASHFLESTPLPSPHTVFLCQTLFNLFFLLSLCNDRWWWQLSLPWLRIPLLSVLYYCSVQKYGKVVVHKWNFLCLSHNLSPVILVLHLFVLRVSWGPTNGPSHHNMSISLRNLYRVLREVCSTKFIRSPSFWNV